MDGTPYAPDRSLAQVRAELLALQRDVGGLATRVLQTRATFRMLFNRSTLREFDKVLAEQFYAFMNIDADLAAHCDAPMDYNSATRKAAQMQLHLATRDSVRGLLNDTHALVAALHNQLDFRGSLLIAVVALLLSMLSAASDLFGLIYSPRA